MAECYIKVEELGGAFIITVKTVSKRQVKSKLVMVTVEWLSTATKLATTRPKLCKI